MEEEAEFSIKEAQLDNLKEKIAEIIRYADSTENPILIADSLRVDYLKAADQILSLIQSRLDRMLVLSDEEIIEARNKAEALLWQQKQKTGLDIILNPLRAIAQAQLKACKDFIKKQL